MSQPTVRSVSALIFGVLVLVISACTTFRRSDIVEGNATLARVGVFAEDSLYSCMLNAYNQGLPLSQARDECYSKLVADDKNGLPNLSGSGTASKAPARSDIVTACGGVDPKTGRGKGDIPGYGSYTFQRNNWADEARVADIKQQNITTYEIALQNFRDAVAKEGAADAAAAKAHADAVTNPSEKTTNAAADANARAAAAAAETNRLYAQALDLKKAAEKDPNKKEPAKKDPPPKDKETVGGDSPCEEAIATATEFLHACQRTAWKDFACQQLQASMNNCPDPALILVNPEQGYACGAQMDSAALQNAWLARCEQLARYGPGDTSPCKPPVFDKPGQFAKGSLSDICHNLQAMPDPENGVCNLVTTGGDFGQPGVQQVLVTGCDKLGGPCIFIPKNPKPPAPGIDPRPGPQPN